MSAVAAAFPTSRYRTEALSPRGRVTKSIDVLGMAIEGERNQTVSRPVSG
jgi:hypothetical protein